MISDTLTSFSEDTSADTWNRFLLFGLSVDLLPCVLAKGAAAVESTLMLAGLACCEAGRETLLMMLEEVA